MTLVVLGIDALDPDLVDPADHPNLALEGVRSIGTIDSSAGEPSTHELWPTIITGLPPEEHGLVLDDGVAWENPVLRIGSAVADYLLPDSVQTTVGAWLLTNTEADAFRAPASYYRENGISTIFDDRAAAAIGIPNYVTDPDDEDREHQLRRSLGDLFERTDDEPGGHASSDPDEFYERCMEMAMIRIARARRALRRREYELVFSYTSALDLIGHVSYDRPDLQERAYEELDEFVGELRSDLSADDELLLVSDHGLQDGLHTHEAMVASTASGLADPIGDVRDVRSAIDAELSGSKHVPTGTSGEASSDVASGEVEKQLEDLGYI